MGLAVHAALAGQAVDSDEANEFVQRFEAGEWGQRAARAKRIEREFDFLFEMDDVILRGQIDLWFEESNGQLILIDYKTDRDETSAENYRVQLRLYALALERYVGRMPDRALLNYVRSERVVEVSLVEADLGSAREAVRQLREAQEHGRFPLKPGEQCRKCLFFGGLCPEGHEGGVRSESGNGLLFGPPSSFLAPALRDP